MRDQSMPPASFTSAPNSERRKYRAFGRGVHTGLFLGVGSASAVLRRSAQSELAWGTVPIVHISCTSVGQSGQDIPVARVIRWHVLPTPHPKKRSYLTGQVEFRSIA